MQTLQRKDDDCGAAALSSLLDIPYEDIEAAWLSTLKRPTDASTFIDLIKVARTCGVSLGRVWWSKSNAARITRARAARGTSHSHWVVLYPNRDIWCPWYGFYSSEDTDYPMPVFSQSLIII